MNNNAPYIWVDGNIIASDQSGCTLLEHGLHYGTGVFEGIRCYPTANGPAIFRLDAHMKRLKAGAEVLGMSIDTDELAQAALDVLHANQHQSAYIRPIIFYGAGSLGLDVGEQLVSHSVVASMPWKSHLGEAAENKGVLMKTSSVRRVPASSVPPLKLCGAYVNSIIAKREATQAGFEEALFLDPDGRICEATGENVFMVKHGVVTAVEHHDALPGITRDTIISLSQAEERAVYLEELLDADEVFLTGTSAEVAPVTRIDNTEFKIGPVTRKLQALYQDLVHGRLPQHNAWLTRVRQWAA
ncbi:MAG: branched-chain amino acid transaminase [Myxococcota bacterium]